MLLQILRCAAPKVLQEHSVETIEDVCAMLTCLMNFCKRLQVRINIPHFFFRFVLHYKPRVL